MRASLSHRGFTLIELVLVIGMIGVLSGLVIVSVNPERELAAARNEQRRADIKMILEAVYRFGEDHNGVFPPDLPTIATNVCRSTPNADCTGLVNLNVLTGAYLSTLPKDPIEATENDTYYSIVRSGGRITVAAPGAEAGQTIFVIR